MYKFVDTQVLDVTTIGGGSYALAESWDCEERYGTGYSIRHYPDMVDADPWSDNYADHVDFGSLEDGIGHLEAFPDEHHAELIVWLATHLD